LDLLGRSDVVTATASAKGDDNVVELSWFILRSSEGSVKIM
jgi:hypothetical protein